MLRVHDKRTFILYLIAAVVAVGAANFISRDLFFRLDITDNGIYSLSESSKKVVEKIEDRLTMKVYFSDNLPGDHLIRRVGCLDPPSLFKHGVYS